MFVTLLELFSHFVRLNKNFHTIYMYLKNKKDVCFYELPTLI